MSEGFKSLNTPLGTDRRVKFTKRKPDTPEVQLFLFYRFYFPLKYYNYLHNVSSFHLFPHRAHLSQHVSQYLSFFQSCCYERVYDINILLSKSLRQFQLNSLIGYSSMQYKYPSKKNLLHNHYWIENNWEAFLKEYLPPALSTSCYRTTEKDSNILICWWYESLNKS